MFENITQEGPGIASAATHTWEIIIMLLVAALIGLLLGYVLWSRFRSMYLDMKAQNERLHSKLTDLEKEHASLKYKHDELEKDNNGLRAKIRSLEADKVILNTKLKKLEAALEGEGGNEGQEAMTTAQGLTGAVKADDFKKIEGIGPKIEQLLKDAGIQSYAQLAAASVDKLKEILEKAGSRYQMHDPSTWPKQAQLAAEGKWKELEEYQSVLSGGRTT
ncbi:MAG: DUF4332 domain-containing protein [Bacteroidetes bacterium]|nr:MAG: DUF4332 domain-containing protein [Bacteroidota bacterium]